MRYLKKTANQKEKLRNTSWEQAAHWYDTLLEESESTYQKDLILPNILRLLELKSGEKVLDLGCGQGFFSREFFKAGAEVVGVDLSEGLITLARERSPKEIRFVASPAESLGFLEQGSFDAAAVILAAQNMRNPEKVFLECARVLRSGGRLAVVINHPCFRIPKRSFWGFDEEKKIQFRRIDEYISESEAEIVLHPSSPEGLKTVSFHRPLQFYFKALGKAGFSLRRLEEWVSNRTSAPGPRSAAENKARREFPLFLALTARKL